MHTYFLIQGSPTGILFKDTCQERWLDLYEMADTLSRKGTLIPPYHSEVPYAQAASNIQHKLRKTHWDLLERKISNQQWKDQIQALPNWLRWEAVAQFQLATGHDCLAKHLHHIGILRSLNCTCCNQGIMDSNHLNICSALTSTTLTDRYWEAKRKMMAITPQWNVLLFIVYLVICIVVIVMANDKHQKPCIK